ncbi:PAN domain-containing protein [Litorimonas taeanensis]|uniref:PAN domain-containing protein n=1 Tax=Litorimonas taeanensis TaxID=568099 RepID=A0A420WKP0_9PROT|nr:PAN domain-containing protein [Litorimonas taeanensis]RKQ71611.1 PAN domain-containing protein [Litorimonas taeanensis]
MRAFLSGLSLAFVTTTSAIAVDLGQYRPGTPYQSVIAAGADICESHCSGDAQCRSWNYVKANPKASGVCEFNAEVSAPVASAISISGVNLQGATRRGIVTGDTNTIRVGTQTISPRSSNSSSSVTQNTPMRRIIREATPQRAYPQTAVSQHTPTVIPRQRIQQHEALRGGNAYQVGPTNRSATQPYPQGTAVPHQFTYDLGGRAMPMQRQMPLQHSTPNQLPSGHYTQTQQPPEGQRVMAYAPNTVPQSSAPQQPISQMGVQSRDRRRQQGPRQENLNDVIGQSQLSGRMSAGQAYPPTAYMKSSNPQQQAYLPNQPSVGGAANTIAVQQNYAMARRSANQPVTYRQPEPSNEGASRQVLPAKALARGLSTEQAQQSLYGKLNDDIQVPNSGATVPSNPDAPIPTMTMRPAVPVERASLDDLAGAPGR